MLFLNVCEKADFLSVIYYIKYLIDIIGIIVPIALIIMVGIQLGKIVIGDVKIIPKVAKSIVVKSIAAVAVFFIPSIVSIVLSYAGQVSYSATACWNNANAGTIAHYRAIEEAEKEKEKADLNKAMGEAKKELERVQKLREEESKKNAELRNKYKTLKGVFSKDVIYYNQCDFKAYPYGNISGASICSHGCGPTSSAVIASTFLGVSGHTPIDTTKWICDNGGCTSSGTYAGSNAQYLKHVGLDVSGPYYWTNDGIDLLMNKLATGKYLALILVADRTGRGIFTSGGHYFVLTGVQNGEFTIAQVSRPAQNDQTWPLSAFDGDVSNFYLVTQKGL